MRERPDPNLHPEWAGQNPVAAAILELAFQVGRLSDVYLYVNQQEDEADEAPEGMSLSDLPEDHPSFRDGSAWGVQKVSRP